VSFVVSDSSPIQYLIFCRAVDVLPRLYDRVILPASVAKELSHPRTPAEIKTWLSAPPAWISVQSAKEIAPIAGLGLGEREAISLAEELNATQLLIDEQAARRVALERGLRFSGTVGILEQAAARRLLDLPNALKLLLGTNFRIDVEVVRNALARDAVRRKSTP